MKKPVLTLGRVVLTLLVVAFACVVVWRMTMYYMFAPWTRDGHIRADVVQIAPDVSGLIKQVDVRDNQPVIRDQVLFVIDQERFKLALRQAEATEADRKETLAQAQRESRRNRGLGNLVSRESLEVLRQPLEERSAISDIASRRSRISPCICASTVPGKKAMVLAVVNRDFSA